MKRNKLVLSMVTAAALASFGAANAQTDTTVTANPSVGVDATVSPGVSVPSDSGTSPSASAESSMDTQAGATGSEGDRDTHGMARGHDPERAKGLDRADEVAGIHGRHGRDTAREEQDRN